MPATASRPVSSCCSPSANDEQHAVKAAVRQKYAEVATGQQSCCAPADDVLGQINFIGDDYAGVAGHVADADLQLGCGIPTEVAELREGQTVLDLGSGAGNDVFVARTLVGETGRVVGVDFTPEMVQKAKENAQKLGFENVTFVEGDIEALPLEDASVDVIISNCVLNLVPDKARAFAEMHRVLRPGGHFCVSDVVTVGALPEAVRSSMEAYAGCVAGAEERAAYLERLAATGFEAVEVRREKGLEVPDAVLAEVYDDLATFRDSGAGLKSITVFGRKPAA